MSKKIVLTFGAGILAIALVAGTWAYYTSITEINNDLHTQGYGNRTIEEFTPEDDWEPGETVIKTAAVENTGDYPLVVRVKFDEKWAREGAAFQTIASTGKIDTVAYTAGPPEEWTAEQTDATDGLTNGDETVVYKLLSGIGDGTNGTWIKGSDGYFYYRAQLAPGVTSSDLLESITMASNIDLGVYTTAEYYSTADKDAIQALKDAVDAAAEGTAKDTAKAALEAGYSWTLVPAGGFADDFDQKTITFRKAENALGEKGGYSNADYTLTITTEVCQATKEAVDATWTMTAADLAGIKTAWNLSES